MKKKESCPTCGTRMSRLNDPNLWRTCNSCSRTNPRKYAYCGWCASPMENTEMRRRLSEVAAPPGGWPSLASELVEVRFFMERGNFADAFELLAILRQRYPLHPELEEFTESTRPSLAVDTDVHQVVDGVLANSAGLSGTSVGRRAAPHWNAPQAKGALNDETGSHTAVSATEFDDERVALPRRRTPKQAGRGHQPISVVPVVPIIPDSARIVAPKKKRKTKKKRLMTHRYERAEGPLRDEPQEVVVEPEVVPEALEAAPERAPVAAADVAPMAAVELAQEVAESLSVAEATPDLIEPGERERARAAGQFEVIEAAAEPVYRVSEDMGPVPSALPPVDTQPLDPLDMEEVANLADAAVPEPVIELEPEPEPVNPHAEQIAAAKRAAARRARKAARKAAADAAEQRRGQAAVEAARLAVEEAVNDLTDRPGAQTGRTHVGAPPEAPAITGETDVTTAPAVTGDTSVAAAPAVTGDTAVGTHPLDAAPPVEQTAVSPAPTEPASPPLAQRSAPEPRTETAVGLPPSAEPGYVPPRGLTLAVNVLQVPRPFDDDGTPAKGKRNNKTRKRSMKPRKRSSKLATVSTEQQEADRKERARRRAARFGEGILGK